MEQHPIPQDVTGFQFKLIGTMTVKQFGYIAVGAIFAVISWYAPVHGFLWLALTRGVLVPIFGATGVIVAFVPIEGRPVDVMAVNFVHAILSPNQYVYIKKGRRFSFTQVRYAIPLPQNIQARQAVSAMQDSKKEERLHALLAETSYKGARGSLDQKERVFLQSITPAEALPINPSSKSIPPQTQIIASQNIATSNTASTPSISHAAKTPEQLQPKPVPRIHFQMPQQSAKNTALSLLSDTPNVIIGIVKDARGNMLPNILAEVKDKDGTPVRAFKTNPLGQFASATPLPDGEYMLELEDPKKQHAFDIITINPKGEIMQPIEIISHDAREELRKALFN